MFEVIQQSDGTAARRRVYFSLIDSTDHFSAKDITVSGVKARITKNSGTSAASTADIVKLDGTNMPGEYYLELTAAECDTVGVLSGYLKPTGCDVTVFQASVVAYDPYADGPTTVAIAAAVLSAATAAPIASDVKKVNAVTIAGAGTTLDPWGPA